MPIYKGNTKIVKLYKGATEIVRRYKGTDLIYQNSLLPSGYIECEYLESSGTQYIDTGLTGNENTKIVVDMACSSNGGQSIGYFATDRSITLQFAPNGTAPSRFGTYSFVYSSWTADERAVYEIDVSGYKKNGVYLYQNSTPQSFETGNLYLFRCNGSSSIRSFRIYDYKIYSNGVLVQHLIPSLDQSGTPCMYDAVSKTTLYNRGTGQFIYKIKLPNGYTACEYLGSTGTQYIDTGYYATNTSGINIDYAYTASGNAGLCGIFQNQQPRTDTLFITTLTGQTSTEIYLISQGGEATNNVVPVLGTKYNAKINYLNNGKLIIDNGRAWNNGTNGVVSSRTIKLFCRDYNGNLAYTNARIYMCLISEDGNLVRHLVPCLDNNNVPCMYDGVEKQTYYNAGSGTFIYG